MAKSRKRKLKPRQKATLSIAELEQRAAQNLNNARYKDAIDDYKALYKQEAKEDWRQGLLAAYLGRVKALAAKGMVKEAAVLWENMRDLCEESLEFAFYLDCLLRAGQDAKAARLFFESEPAFQKSAPGQKLNAYIAYKLLSGDKALRNAVPQDSPLLRQLVIVEEALQAYCQGDDARLLEQLKAIPVRSPYRDLRLLLQAVVKSDDQAFNAGLAKIADDSPLAAIKEVFLATRSPAAEKSALLEGMDRSELELLAALSDWDNSQRVIARKINQSGHLGTTVTSAKACLQLVLDHVDVYGEQVARRYALAMLSAYPGGVKSFNKKFGPLSAFEQHRLKALEAEDKEQFYQAVKHWDQCFQLLSQDETNPDNGYSVALILRYSAELPDQLPEEVVCNLEMSLDLDPHCKQTYLKLIDLLKITGQPRHADRWLEAAKKHLPKDPEIIMLAAQAAYDRGAFKKAANYANGLLKRDAINTTARQLLLQSLFGHARKQVRQGKFEQAMKELQHAEESAQNDAQRGELDLLKGLIAAKQAKTEAEASLFLDFAVKYLGAGLDLQARFWIEGKHMGVDGKVMRRLAAKCFPSLKSTVISVAEVMRLARLCAGYPMYDSGVDDALCSLQPALSKAVSAGFNQSEFREICDLFMRRDYIELVHEYGKAALTQWPDEPIFIYFELVSRDAGRAVRVSESEEPRLQQAFERAEAKNDLQAMHVIGALLDELNPAPMPVIPADIRKEMEILGLDESDVFEMMERIVSEEFGDAGLPSPKPRLPPTRLPKPKKPRPAPQNTESKKKPSEDPDYNQLELF